MTRLEYYAAQALVGILAADSKIPAETAADAAVQYADALATALEKRLSGKD